MNKKLQALRSKEADKFTASLPPVISEDIWGGGFIPSEELPCSEWFEFDTSTVEAFRHSYHNYLEDAIERLRNTDKSDH